MKIYPPFDDPTMIKYRGVMFGALAIFVAVAPALNLGNLASMLESGGKHGEAEALYSEALAMERRLYPERGHPSLVSSLAVLASALTTQGKCAEAEPLYRSALQMCRDLLRDYALLRSEGDALALATAYRLPEIRHRFLGNARRLRAEPDGTVTMPISCRLTWGPCDGRLELLSADGGRRLGSTPITLAAGEIGGVTLRLRRRAPAGAAQARAVLNGPGGTHFEAASPVTLRR